MVFATRLLLLCFLVVVVSRLGWLWKDGRRRHGVLVRKEFVYQSDDAGDDGCITSVDCAMNGECRKDNSPNADVQAPGTCDCFPGWKGSRCEVLDLLPVDPQQLGLQLPNRDSSTWGGSVLYRDGVYHMFASEIINGCGLYAWTTNSQVIRAVSESPYGPYRKVEVVVPIFAHDANAMEDPTTGVIVLYVTARSGVRPRDCHSNPPTTLPEWWKRRRRRTSSSSVVPPKDTYMLWAPTPEGPWSDPVMVLNSTIWNSDYWAKTHRVAKCDSNLNGQIQPDGSFLGLWRRCETPDLLTIPHTLTASHWKDPSSYQPHTTPLFVLGGSGAEDPSNIWTTSTSDMPGVLAYHAIFHDEQATRCMLGQCSANGRHAFSLEREGTTSSSSSSWRYASVDAYQREVSMTNGTTLAVDTRARPHMILDPTTQQPIALSTGLKETDASGYVWTLVQPIRNTRTEPVH